MNTLRQREIFKLGFQIHICQSKEKKMQILLQLTQDPFPINIRYIYDQFAHGVQPNKKKQKTKSSLQPTILTANQRIVISAN